MFVLFCGIFDEYDDYVAILGRVCPEKDVGCGLRAARLAGVSARLAGQVFPYPEHERYFDEEVLPLLDTQRRFIGPVGGWAKRELLARARAVVVPSRIDETSSLTVMEALACGTPAIVTRHGALPELVEHGVTGWHVDDVESMAKAIELAPELSRAACRQAATRRFGIAEMARAYLTRYERAARGEAWGRDSARRTDNLLRAQA
jgi:glycosyltransferase involved in cell wall biosynthesis